MIKLGKPFNIDEFIDGETENFLIARKYFYKEFSLFEEITTIYGNVFKEFRNHSLDLLPHLSLFNNCYKCSVIGFTNSFKANVRFSYYYLRVISESVQYSIFMSRFKESERLWTSENQNDLKEFSRRYRKWFTREGQDYISKEYPILIKAYKDSSFIIHANFESMALQHRINVQNDLATYRINFHDATPDRNGTQLMLSGALNHLVTYVDCLEWWINGDLNLINDDQFKVYFNTLSKKIRKHAIDIANVYDDESPE